MSKGTSAGSNSTDSKPNQAESRQGESLKAESRQAKSIVNDEEDSEEDSEEEEDDYSDSEEDEVEDKYRYANKALMRLPGGGFIREVAFAELSEEDQRKLMSGEVAEEVARKRAQRDFYYDDEDEDEHDCESEDDCLTCMPAMNNFANFMAHQAQANPGYFDTAEGRSFLRDNASLARQFRR